MSPVAHILLFAAAVSAPLEHPTETAVACELHIWAAGGMTDVRQRAFESNRMAGVIPELIRQTQQHTADIADAEAKTRLAESTKPDPLSLPEQRELLGNMPLATMLDAPDHRVIIHGEPLDSRTIRTVRTRYASSTAPCYAELVLAEVVYSREYARGRNLKTLFRYRRFGNGDTPEFSFGTWTQTKLELFSLDPLVADAPALNELASALRSNVVLFSEYLKHRRQLTAKNSGE